MFILSKVLLFLLFPITWVAILLVWAVFSKSKRIKQLMLAGGLIVLYIFSIQALLDAYAKLWRYPLANVNNGNYSCAIILGGFGSEKADSTGYFNGASDRFIQGLKLLASSKAKHILVTSGNASIKPDAFSEGTWVEGQLKALHVPDTAVLIERRSRNTIENALFTKQLLAKTTLKPPYLLVTSDSHMRRAMLIFQKTGLDVVPYPCNYGAGVGKTVLDSFIPKAHVLADWEIYTKELVGFIVAKLHKY